MIDMMKALIVLLLPVSLTLESGIRKAPSADLLAFSPTISRYQSVEEPADIIKLQQQLAACKAKGDKLGMAEMYHRMGIWYKRKGQYRYAEQRFYQALVLLESLRHEEAIAFTCLQLGTTYSYQERYSEALHYLFRAKEIARKRRLTQLGRDLNQHIAFAYTSLGKYEEAHRYRQQID